MEDIILGAGFSGLSAGMKLKCPIYEATDHAGGICRSYWIDGYQFNVGGGHWIFGKGKGLDLIKSLVEVKDYVRDAGVYYNHIFPFPIQEFAQKDIVSNEGTLKRWLSDHFSKQECNFFFNPFNGKYTCGLFDEIIQDDSFKTPKLGDKGHVATFFYPKQGLSHLVDQMKRGVEINYGFRAIRIDTENKEVIFNGGESVRYDRLISTIPLDSLLMLCGMYNHDLLKTSVIVLNIGAERLKTTPKEHWIYVPYCKSGFFRLQFYSNIEPTMAQESKVGLCVETSYLPGNIGSVDVEVLKDEVIRELQSWGFIGNVEVCIADLISTAYTWVKAGNDTREKNLAWLRERGIISTGRYGKWKFQGMVQSIEDGINVGEELNGN